MTDSSLTISTTRGNMITTEEDLFFFLVQYARRFTPKVMFPKAIVDFADEVMGAVVAQGRADGLEEFDTDERSLLTRNLLYRFPSEEMRPHHRELVDFATQVYGGYDVDREKANRALIQVLDLGRSFFEQVQERSDGFKRYLLSTALFRERFEQEVRIQQLGWYSYIRSGDGPMVPSNK